MSIGILVGKIAALFIVMFLGFVLVKTGICRSDDSRILSRLSVYIVVPLKCYTNVVTVVANKI